MMRYLTSLHLPRLIIGLVLCYSMTVACTDKSPTELAEEAEEQEREAIENELIAKEEAQYTLDGPDPTGDQECADDPGVTGRPELDITHLNVRTFGVNAIKATITFAASIEEWDLATEKFPFSLQLQKNDESFVEILPGSFEGEELKVSDPSNATKGKGKVRSFEFVENKLCIVMEGCTAKNIKRAGAFTFETNPFEWNGRCLDSLVLER